MIPAILYPLAACLAGGLIVVLLFAGRAIYINYDPMDGAE